MTNALPSSKRLELEHLARRAQQHSGDLVYFDVGARDGLSPAWEMLAHLQLIKAYGFDPAADHIEELRSRNDPVEYLPIALGDCNDRKRLIHTFMPGCSSFLEPNFDLLQHYPASKIFEVVGESEVEVRTIEHLVNTNVVPPPRILKLDTQGFELPVLKGALAVLPHVICIELETQFKPLYRGQALFPEVKGFLDDQGFILRQLSVNGPYEGEFLEANAYFSRRPTLDGHLDLIRLWQTACGIESPQFLAQMDDWKPGWKTNLTSEQMELRRRLFGPLN